ncbi:MAG: hypothetical protein R8K46_00335 [Mariprofundaceae bacterium]
MLIYCILQKISTQWQKRGFSYAYTRLQESNLARVTPEGGHTWTYGMKSSSYMLDLAALPWAAWKRRINQRFPNAAGQIAA